MSDVPNVTPVPPLIPPDAKVLFGAKMLLAVFTVAVVLPFVPTPMAIPAMLASGAASVPLPVISKLPCPLPLVVTRIALVPIFTAALSPLILLFVILMTLVTLPGVPTVPLGPATLLLPPCTRMPAPLGKLEISLLSIVALVKFDAVVAEPSVCKRMALPSDVATVVGLTNVLPVITASASVPLKFCTSMPCEAALLSVLPVTVRVPDRLFSVPVTAVLKAMFDSLATATEPLVSITPLVNVKLVT